MLELKCKGVTCVELVGKLAGVGNEEKEANVRDKRSTGKFGAAFLLGCLIAIGSTVLHLE